MALQHFSHQHTLNLVDELSMEVLCYGCQKPILSSAYACIDCNYFLHKKCAELPQGFVCRCNVCGVGGWKWFTYHCSECKFNAHVTCTPLEERDIEHKFHDHPLAFMNRAASFFCDACGIEGEDLSYRCTDSTCQFWIHDRCASSTSSIKRNDHEHHLDLAYSFPHSHRNFDYDCYVCKKIVHPTYWIYHCISCRYFVHLKCATSYVPFRLSIDKSDSKSEEDVYSSLIHFPMPDEPEDLARQFVNDNVFGDNIENIIKCLFCESADDLVHFEVQSSDSKQNEHSLCDVCVQPISFPFYACGKCGFILHKKCSHLPKEIQNHPFHSDHTLSLSCLKKYLKMFSCSWCHRVIVDGIRFSCNRCSFRLGVCCASTCFPNSIKHESHDLPLVQTQATTSFKCAGCGDEFKSCLKYGCETRGFHLDSYCTMLPKTIRHDWDRHPVSLTYPPFYDHPDDFFCELYEEQMHPNHWLYHCRICDQSFHPKCLRPFDRWSNIKLGDTCTFEDHSHKLTLVRKGKNNLRSPCDHCHTLYLDDPPPPILECTTCNFQVCMLCAHNGDTRSTRMEITSPYDDSLFTFITSGIYSAISSLFSW